MLSSCLVNCENQQWKEIQARKILKVTMKCEKVKISRQIAVKMFEKKFLVLVLLVTLISISNVFALEENPCEVLPAPGTGQA